MELTLTSEQNLLIAALKKWYRFRTKPYFLYVGCAGCGKTTVIKYFIKEMFLKYNDVRAIAFTGQATSVLLQHELNASTIHSLIYDSKFESVHVTEADGNVVIVNKKNKLNTVLKKKLEKKIKLIIVDEASMVNDKMWEHILSFKIPTIFMGDINQLPPVTGLCSKMKNPDFILTQIMRQSLDNPIIYLSQCVLNNIPLEYGTYGSSKIIDRIDIDENILKDYDIIICGKNKTREKLNNIIRHEVLKIERKEPIIGDKMISKQNDWSFDINGVYMTNGMVGYITDIDYSTMHKEYITVDFKPEFMKKEFKNLELDYKYMKTDVQDRHSYGYSKYHKFEFGYAITAYACVPKDTLIYTEDGITELINLQNYKGRVYNGSCWEYPSKYIDNGVAKVNVLTLSNNTKYSVTDYHKCKILSRDGIETVYGKDIHLGHEMLLRVNQNLYEDKVYTFSYNERVYKKDTKLYTLPNILCDRLSLIIGMICADGTITPRSIKYYKHHHECVQLFSEYVKEIFNYDAMFRKLSYEDCWMCEIGSVHIRDFFYEIQGLRPCDKYVPSCILSGSISNQCAFLKGFFEDGAVHLKHNEFDMIELTFKNNKMIPQLNSMLSNIGISPSFAKRYKRNSVLNNLYIFKHDACIFREKINFITKDKQKRLNTINISRPRRGSKLLAKVILDNYKYDKFNANVDKLKRGGILTHQNFINICNTIPLEDKNSNWVLYIRYIFENFVVLTVEDIYDDYADTACLEMPDSHMFLQDGILGGNSQGSEYPRVLFIDEPFYDKETLKMLRYTAITRARESITIVRSPYMKE